MTISIVIADDHKVVRQGLRSLLDAEPDLKVVGEAGDGREALKTVEEQEPDVLVLDLMIPRLGGLEVTRQVAKGAQKSKVVILSMHADEAYVLEALNNGASAYVLKCVGIEELKNAVREAAAGRRYLSSPLSDRAIQAYASKARGAATDPYDRLTNREREVFQLAAEGNSNPDIAETLHISVRTVETHRANLMRKLGLHNQAELTRCAIQKGILPLNG